jgi:hypothetical protein
MTEVYHGGFAIFFNVPFMIAAAFVASILLAAWFIKQGDNEEKGQFPLSAALVLGALVLVWVLLSEQIYQYFWCQNKYVESLDNWQRLSQMYMSVAWAIYAAVLIVIGFMTRAAGIRYLSVSADLRGPARQDQPRHLAPRHRIPHRHLHDHRPDPRRRLPALPIPEKQGLLRSNGKATFK